MSDKQALFEKISETMQEMFELTPEQVTPEAHLFHDLDLDSIDAVDLIVTLQDITGYKLKPDQFKTVRTVNDVVNAVDELLKEQQGE
ncbi:MULTISPECIES: acyl carrier protein [unclassified Motilimonas]|uniref:acyl carrier protein n=1 Tax=Motilimonas TaxID=1914248 RepID=UPI001E2EA32E|nr:MULTISPECIES: acyl carrier protein [unclassified Motilimonas]MCE0556460.1 acyl carrier protein [Motilimonas sp. E26]MDO6527089.1 acyl carrier protein [Motilimonas sp. 1_MG-2023]